MTKLRVLFDPQQKRDGVLETVSEFPLVRDDVAPSILSLGEHRLVKLPSGDEFALMCEFTNYGNTLSIYQDKVRVLGIKVEGKFEIAMVLPSGNEVVLDIV